MECKTHKMKTERDTGQGRDERRVQAQSILEGIGEGLFLRGQVLRDDRGVVDRGSVCPGLVDVILTPDRLQASSKRDSDAERDAVSPGSAPPPPRPENQSQRARRTLPAALSWSKTRFSPSSWSQPSSKVAVAAPDFQLEAGPPGPPGVGLGPEKASAPGLSDPPHPRISGPQT